ncbi:hypothetical protein NIES4101_56720 [Calothrix sp. NIES-4101]|nr:hypothetical protein NIES4101_56720 [Calothrix sp. NIES-4101]
MYTVVRFTPKSVVGEIQKVLDTYAYNPYQKVFAVPDLRQELIDYVVNRIPCFDSDYKLDSVCAINSKLPRNPLEAQLYLQNLIHQGIHAIMQEKSEWISLLLCDTIQPGCEPSHWFG